MKITLLTSKLDLNRIERQKVKTFVFRHVLEQISTLSDYLSIHFPVRWRGKWLRGLWLVCVLFCSEMLWKHWFWKEKLQPYSGRRRVFLEIWNQIGWSGSVSEPKSENTRWVSVAVESIEQKLRIFFKYLGQSLSLPLSLYVCGCLSHFERARPQW